jgi:hypothetical protein
MCARLRVIYGMVCAGCLTFGTVEGASAQKKATPAAAPAGVLSGTDLVKALDGSWRAPEYTMERESALDEEVFGAHATDVRNVELDVEPSGDAVLRICSAVVDQKGKPFAPTLFDAKLALTPPAASGADAFQPRVSVESAEEWYFDSGTRWMRQGYHVTLTARPRGSAIDALDLRFDTPQGDGSFWTTLVRQGAGADRRLASAPTAGQRCGGGAARATAVTRAAAH